MGSLSELLFKNRQWAENNKKQDINFFSRLIPGQFPQYLWIGCCDSRVPAEMITGSQPGELLVHRNVANMVLDDDTSCLSVLQLAVEVLKVQHIIIVGHSHCGGVTAALNSDQYDGSLGSWLQNLKSIFQQHEKQFNLLSDEKERINLLCELNAVHQAVNVANTSIVRKAWKNNSPLVISSCIYNFGDGLLKKIGESISEPNNIPDQYQSLIQK
ncbi:MAG: carbonic anhydrase [Endozoicomonadaceae bacterium]|nr:carbonic anhydrase [Endozoicomonadaceae bacterium]